MDPQHYAKEIQEYERMSDRDFLSNLQRALARDRMVIAESLRVVEDSHELLRRLPVVGPV